MSIIPFDREKEMQVTGYTAQYLSYYGTTLPPMRKLNKPITSRENVLRVYRHEEPMWVPSCIEDMNLLQPLCMPDAQARNYGGIDWFGIEWEYEPKSNAAMVKPGTRRMQDILTWKEELTFPDLSAIDWQGYYDENYAGKLDPDKATEFVIVNGCMERLADLSSFEDALSWLLIEPEAVGELFEKFTDFHIELARIAHEIFHADIITFHDDLGTQRSPFISRDVFEEVLFPHYRRMNDAIHEMGMYTNFHSCGNVDLLLDGYVEAGFDSWEGQDNANDKIAQMERLGDKLIHHTNFFLTEVVSDEELDRMLRENIETIGYKGRYISFFMPQVPDLEFMMKAYDRFYELGREYYTKKYNG
ncbi:MAG: hypothetical protein K6C09_05070 [Oscillospiraceae bacterium]|nr:hypothetical protein [Oscillospiraceae bacterium]